MSIILKQSAGSLVTPLDDAKMYSLMLGNQTGIIEGVMVSHLGANKLKILAGWGVCQGRQFVIEEETINATVATSGNMKGRLIIHIDTTAQNPITFITQAAAILPNLVQENINGNGTVYEIPIAIYDINEIAISNLLRTAPLAAISAITAYTHTYDPAAHAHTLVGVGDNIKFTAIADYSEGDTFIVNGTACTAQTQNTEPLDDEYFKTGGVIGCFKNGNVLNFGYLKKPNNMSTIEHWTGEYDLVGDKIYEKTISVRITSSGTLSLQHNVSSIKSGYIVHARSYVVLDRSKGYWNTPILDYSGTNLSGYSIVSSVINKDTVTIILGDSQAPSSAILTIRYTCTDR